MVVITGEDIQAGMIIPFMVSDAETHSKRVLQLPQF
jgi:hypothetical protein